MSQLILDEDIVRYNDEIIRVSPLEQISEDLLQETFKTQLESPYDAVVNCLEEFNDCFTEEAINCESDTEGLEKANAAADKFYTSVIMKISDKYELDIDPEVIGELDLKALTNLAEGLYGFFIIGYMDNITIFINKMIMNNLEQLVNYINENSAGNNASLISYKKKMKNKDVAIVLSNINMAISAVKDFEIEAKDFIDLFNSDKFDVAVLKYAINKELVDDGFVRKFVEPITDRMQDDIYDSIVFKVQESLFQKFKKDTPEIDDREDEN